MSGVDDGLVPVWLQITAALWLAVSLVGLMASVGLAIARPLLVRRRPKRQTSEPVSVVIPVKTLDHGFAQAQASVLRSLPPGSEIIVASREESSPALAAARNVFADAGVPVRFLRSTATFAASPKVDNLAEAFEAASHDLLFMKDSNVELSPDGVAPAIAALREDVGLVCAIPRAMDASTFAAAIEAQVMNQSHGRLLLMADAIGLGFGVGKIMVFRRSALAHIGGLAVVAHSVGEDSALARAFAQVGLRTVFMAPVVTQRLGARQMRDVADRQMRWTAVRASNEKLAFALEPIGLCVVAAAAAALAAPLLGLSPLVAAALCIALWFACETALALSQGWEVSPSAPVVMIARDTLMLSVWVRAWFTRRVMWAGNSVPVRTDALAPATDVVAARRETPRPMP